MTPEQFFYIRVLKDHLFGKNTDIEKNTKINANTVINYAINHNMIGILYFQLKDCFSKHPELSQTDKKLRPMYMKTIVFSQKRRYEIDLIKNEFIREKIPFFIVKGGEIEKIWPVPELRVMGDTDIIIKTEDRKHADDVMKSLGFTVDNFYDGELHYRKNGINVEIHSVLLYKDAVNKPGHIEYFNDFWDKVTEIDSYYKKLDDDFHFIYLVDHLRKHLMHYSAGFRQFMDIAIFAKKNERSMNWEKIRTELEKLGLFDFYEITAEFIKRWFDIEIPLYSAKEINDEFFEDATKRVFDGGVFGFNDDKNTDNTMINKINASDSAKKTVFKKIFFSVFPKYQTLCNAKEYKFLQGRTILLPVAWIYRFGRGILHKKVTKVVTTAVVSNEKMKERNDYLSQWKV